MKLYYSFLLLVMIHTTYPMKRTMTLADIVERTMDVKDMVNDFNTAPFNAEEIRNNLPYEFARYAAQARVNRQPQQQRSQEQNRQLVQALRPLVAQRPQPRPGYFSSNMSNEIRKTANNTAGAGKIQRGWCDLNAATPFYAHNHICSFCGRCYMVTEMLLKHLKAAHNQSSNVLLHVKT